MNNGSYDICGIVSYTSTPNTFNCGSIGNNYVRLTVADVNGNTSSCNSIVTINDANNYCTVPKTNTQATPESEAAAAAEVAVSTTLLAYPNPFNEMTTIQFSIEKTQSIVVKVYSLAGTEIAVLFEGMAEAGLHYNLEFRSEGIGSGIYIVKMVSASGETRYEKLILQK